MLAQVDQLADVAPALTGNDVVAPYVWVFLAAIAVSFLLTPIMRVVALKLNLVDNPDAARKAHKLPMPYLGGLAIFLGWAAGAGVSLFLHAELPEGTILNPDWNMLLWISIGAVVIVVVGLLDDAQAISPRVKIGFQLFAAAALANQQFTPALIQDTWVALFHDPMNPIVAYLLGIVLIAIFVVGGCNAMNLLDGLDGLAAGVAGVACIGFLLIAAAAAVIVFDPDTGANTLAKQVAPLRIIMCLALLGAILGFLPFNFNPANIFMGDAGSLLLGYLCVTIIMMFAHTTEMGPQLVMAALIVFALPICDTGLAIVRRRIQRQPIFSADNRHIHHLMLRAMTNLKLGPNASVKLAVLSMYVLAGIFAALGFGLIFFRWRYVVAVFATVFLFILGSAFKSATRLRSGQVDDEAAAAIPAPPSAEAPSSAEQTNA